MENLHKLVNLRRLSLDKNYITKITGIKHLRKLETLSLKGNRLKEPSPTDSSEPLLELKELFLSDNKIECIEAVHSFPNIEEIELSGNPITMIFPGAFSTTLKLSVLIIN